MNINSRITQLAFGALCLFAALSLAPAASAAVNDTTLVSRASGADGAKGNGSGLGSSTPSVSADGRFIAFRSSSSNLDPADTDTADDVFVRDLQQNTLTLVSRASGAGGAKGNGSSGSMLGPAISADGRFVVFRSTASNLDPADTDTTGDVFVRDLQQNTTTLVSRASGASGAKGNGFSSVPTVSADGRFVSFSSAATNLDPADADTSGDAFVRDLQQSTTRLVSRASGASGADGNGFSFETAVSGGGRFVTFASTATNLDPADTDTKPDVFVRDLTGPPDVTPPQTTIDSGPSGPTNDSTPTFAFSSDEAGSSFECRVDTAAFAPCSSPQTTAALSDGSHTFEVRATDAAGNTDATPATRSFSVDTGAPNTTIDSGPSGPTNDSTPTFAFSSSEASSSFECRVDTAAFAPCSSPQTTAALSDGSHTFEVRATDAAGNTDATPATRSFAVDTTAPNPQPQPGPQPGPGPGVSPTCQGLKATVVVAAGSSALRGTPGRDVIVGTNGPDRIDGAGGDDVICANGGNDRIDGGSGNDRISAGSGNDRAVGGSGNDRIAGNEGNDRAGGQSGNDRVSGSEGNDRVNGEAGNDRLGGDEGNDRVSGGAGNDRAAGGSGRDTINGNSGNDRLSGNSGNDRMNGDSGRDRVAGNSGSDRLNTRDRRPRDRADCGESRRDRATVDRGDRVRNCERLRRRG